MATIDSRFIFITTSPRTPAKMIPEIELLNDYFLGQRWNNYSQKAFMSLLKEKDFFHGSGIKDPAFSARDRINRAPKSLGFVSLYPIIKLTPAGIELITNKRKEEIFLRQLLKFQIPSPFHKPSKRAADFWVKPYLEIFRLIRFFESLSFDELRLFALQLTDYRYFDKVVSKIKKFRINKENNKKSYKHFYNEYVLTELKSIFANRIQSGKIKIRETKKVSINKFLKTKASNLRDYADACIRYLRATGLVSISHVGKSVSIVPEKIDEVDFFLKNTDRNPCYIDNENNYIEYLGDSDLPLLLTDNKYLLVKKLKSEFPYIHFDKTANTKDLKNILADELERRKNQLITQNIDNIKKNRLFEEVNTIFMQILDNSLYDNPLMLEWNTWRAMTLLDGGYIKANLIFDDFGNPMSTAQGNIADIICDYGDFGLTVEVTMQVGQRQYETEGEPVTRHLAKLKRKTNKPAFCLFIAPKINEASIAYFYALHKINISYYGGTSTIIPLPLNIFIKMVDQSRVASYIPEPKHIKRLFERSKELALTTINETEWYSKIKEMALNWLKE